MSSASRAGMAIGAATLALWAQAGSAGAQDATERVSVSTSGVQGNRFSLGPTISAGGRFVFFTSSATNLVPRDTNRKEDVFVRDRQTGTTRRISIGPGGVQGNGSGRGAAISVSGRFVLFTSDAPNLVPGDTNGVSDGFVRDQKLATTERVSLGQGGVQGNFSSFATAISADGRFVAFVSGATNLVPDDTNAENDVFVRDRLLGTTERVNLGPGGVQANAVVTSNPSISADGRFVAFASFATNLVPGDTNGLYDVFVRDRQTGVTKRVSLGPGGVEGHGSNVGGAISADGRFVAFHSDAPDLVPADTNGVQDIFVRDRQTGTTERVSVETGGVEANSESSREAISRDGRFVVFSSFASNLVPGDTNNAEDVFVRDRQTGVTKRVSLGPGGVQGNFSSLDTAISAGGRFVGFASVATNLAPGDTNNAEDVFVRQLVP